MPLVELTAVIEGKDLDHRRFASNIRRVLREEADEIDKLYKLFYGTWKGSGPAPADPNKGGTALPNMIKKVSVRGADAYAEVSTRGRTGEFGNRKLLWLDDGTRVRWAVMNNWTSKTRVGQIRSGGGGGRVVRRGKRNMSAPMRGIKARNVSHNIAEERKLPFQLSVDEAIDDATK